MLQNYYIILCILKYLCVNLYYIISVGNYHKILEKITYSVSLFGVLVFNVNFVLSLKSLIPLYIQLSDFKTFPKPINFDQKKSFFNRYARYNLYLLSLIALAFAINPLIEYKTCIKNNELLNISELCGVLTTIWTPFEENNFFVIFIIWAYEFWCVMFIYFVAVLLSYTIVESVGYVTLRFEHFTQMLEYALNEPNKELKKKQIRDCIIYHCQILKWVDIMNDAFDLNMFVHVVLTGAVIGLNAYNSLKVRIRYVTVM